MCSLRKINLNENDLLWLELKNRLKKKGLTPQKNPSIALEVLSQIRLETKVKLMNYYERY